MSNIKERILQLAKLKGVSKEKFCETIEMSYSSFKSSAKNTPLNSDAIGKILSLYPDISADWLITGQGEMLKKEASVIHNNNGIGLIGSSNSGSITLSQQQREVEMLRQQLQDKNEIIALLKQQLKSKK